MLTFLSTASLDLDLQISSTEVHAKTNTSKNADLLRLTQLSLDPPFDLHVTTTFCNKGQKEEPVITAGGPRD